ncbi:phosphate ABC transporter permease subunit PstC [Sporolactobacillus terrae]|uniref:Phosphate transport system permease protein n=1 Tax=Sporolactobacillus terrae TaxID=269673 RepID=A0A410DAA4_9BACL|nr:phosphate ABC transporter permease subunit PstC [Sporolactobacillus terrae]QAA23005.1 phosphate ABC transporter permease subunit PstC [Sporolactobacillus terrae]QAA25978.1 phosphate ABC transporter permease subunit PstC [Sporolactobacillus terrae]UAK15075.1 phosphate ABC transporter permease subunit PstC [Sporolactobacillus terrae]BBN99416.1 putative ABC transporter permease protein YqgH [Sporolactobacillus terrae]
MIKNRITSNAGSALGGGRSPLINEKNFFARLTDRRSESRGKALIYCSALLMIIAVTAITLFLTLQGLRSFVVDHLNLWTFITGTEWYPDRANNPSFGAFPFIFGSLAVTFLAALIATPIAIGTAIFMAEIAQKWGTKIMQPVIEILVGIPSVVYGLIGLSIVAPFMRQHFGGSGFNLITGAIVVGVMILPTVASIAADSIRAVPDSLRQASYAIGATKWQTIWRVVIPASGSSLITAIVLGMSRAFGEALAVQMVIGNARNLPGSILDPAATLTTIITLSMGHTTTGSVLNDVLWSLGLILLLISYVFIVIVRYLAKRGEVR